MTSSELCFNNWLVSRTGQTYYRTECLSTLYTIFFVGKREVTDKVTKESLKSFP